MIKVTKFDIFNLENAIYGMRLPLMSHNKSDSKWVDGKYIVGENDLDLMIRLKKAGSDHRKFQRQIMISMTITAPQYWWREMDTYKVATTRNSSSQMHCAIKKPFSLKDFSFTYDTNKNKDIEIPIENEVWRDIEGLTLYQISNCGRVKKLSHSVIDSNGNQRIYKERIKENFGINSSGYKKITVCIDEEYINKYLHVIMAQAFIPNPDNKPCVNHKDGNKLNNNLDNLEWVTHSENTKHAFDNKLKTITGYTKEKVLASNRLFSDDDIINIKKMFEEGYNKKEIADKYECYSSSICNLLNGHTYKKIELSEIDVLKLSIDKLNELRNKYLETEDKIYWEKMIQLIPQSFNYECVWTGSLENLMNIYHSRKNHKLKEWREFCLELEKNETFKNICLK